MSNLHGDLLDLLDKLQYSLIEEYFGFVSDEIDDILDQTGSPRAKLLAPRDVMRQLGLATPILADSTRDEIDHVTEVIEAQLKDVIDA
jgi:hypothetical protein